MTGIEALLESLKVKRGISKQKSAGNMDFIEAVLTELADEETRKQIDLAQKIRTDAENIREDARQKLREAKKEREEARDRKFEAEIILREIEEKRKDLEQMQQSLDEALQVETPEAKDRVRLYQLFMNDLPENTSSNQNAVIYGAAAILSGQTVFTATAKPNKQ